MRTIPCELPAITFSALSAAESNSSDAGSALITVSKILLPAGTWSSDGSNLWPRMVNAGVENVLNQYRGMAERMRAMIETDGDRLTDLHLWRLGPGHLAAILSVATKRQRGPDHYRALLRRFRFLSDVTVQVQQR